MASVRIEPIGPHDDYMYIKKKGIIDLEQLYADIWRWFEQHAYEIHETDFKAKTPTPIGSEEEIHLAGFRKEDDFQKWWIRLLITIWDSVPVEVIKNGKPKKMHKCRLRVKFDCYMELDYEKKFDKSKILLSLRDFYINTIIRRKIQTEGDKFEYEFHELHDLIKKNLEMDMQGDQYAHYWKN